MAGPIDDLSWLFDEIRKNEKKEPPDGLEPLVRKLWPFYFFIKDRVLKLPGTKTKGDGTGSILYCTLPIWSYKKNCWPEGYPFWYRDEDSRRQYGRLKKIFEGLNFSFVSLMSHQIRRIPDVFTIKFVYGQNDRFRCEYKESGNVKRLTIFFPVNGQIVQYFLGRRKRNMGDVNDEVLSRWNVKIGKKNVVLGNVYSDFVKAIDGCVGVDNQRIPFLQVINSERKDELFFGLFKFLYAYAAVFGQLRSLTVRTLSIFPSKVYKTSRNYDLGYGCFIIASSSRRLFKGGDYEKMLVQILNFAYSSLAISDWADFSNYKDALTSTKAAIGSIMSRNGSHNIGSHVLSALSHNVGTMPDDRILYQYIQHRMDYIATATTEFPKWVTPTMLVGEMMKCFYSQRHLLDFISRSEGLSAYQFQGRNLDDFVRMNQQGTIRIFLRRFYKLVPDNNDSIPRNCYLVYSPDRQQYAVYNFFGERDKLYNDTFLTEDGRCQYEVSEAGKYKFLEVDERSAIDWKQDVSIAIPGGVVGHHAFYTIIENVIRNAAKHSWAHGQHVSEKDLEIFIDFGEEYDKVVFTIGDNMSQIFGRGAQEEFWMDFFDQFSTMKKCISFFGKQENVGQEGTETWKTICERGVETWRKIRKEFRTVLDKKREEQRAILEERKGKQCEITKQEKMLLERKKKQYEITEQEKMLSAAFNIFEGLAIGSEIERVKGLNEVLLRCFSLPLEESDVSKVKKYLRREDRNERIPEGIDDRIKDIQMEGLPFIYWLQREYLLRKDGESIKKYVFLTQNYPDDPERLGKRLALPLHHELQQRLARAFINYDGKLRRENWGLAEMKISAGYLGGFSIEEIGGINGMGVDILIPVAMPATCRNPNSIRCVACSQEGGLRCLDKDSCQTSTRYHLGYQFSVAKPKNILFVIHVAKETQSNGADNFTGLELTPEVRSEILELDKKGIHFAYAKQDESNGNDPEGAEDNIAFKCCNILTNKPIEKFNYPYVVVPDAMGDTHDSKIYWQFGFRRVKLSEIFLYKKDGEKGCLKDIAQTGLGQFNLRARDLCEAVQSAWVQKLAKECQGVEKESSVNLVLNVDGNENGSERGLVTTKDLLWTMFVECYHTALIAFLKNPPATIELGDTTRRLITLLSLLKVNTDSEYMITPPRDIRTDDGAKVYVREQLISYCNLLKDHLVLSKQFVGALGAMAKCGVDACGKDANVDRKIENIESNFEKVIARRLASGLRDEDEAIRKECGDLLDFLQEKDKADLDEWLDAFHGGTKKYCFPYRKDSYASGRHSLAENICAVINACNIPEEDEFNALVESLNSMFLASDVYLRKYEERIATLPEAYKYCESGEPRPPNEKNDVVSKADNTATAEDVSAIADCILLGKPRSEKGYVESDEWKIVKYSRHDWAKPEGAIYAEALSGSQSYLNTLVRLACVAKDTDGERHAEVARLLENAFLRILIIDERVMNFVNDRRDDRMIEIFINMGIWVADVRDGVKHHAVDRCEVTDTLFQLEHENFGEGKPVIDVKEGQFDLLVIHQGVIDKWWDSHNVETVKDVLSDIRKVIPRVVVTTGRGRPDNIPYTEKVLPFSVIESSLFQRHPEKLILVNTIMNLLPYGKEGDSE